MKKTLGIIIITLIFCSTVYAENDTGIIIGGWSHHTLKKHFTQHISTEWIDTGKGKVKDGYIVYEGNHKFAKKDWCTDDFSKCGNYNESHDTIGFEYKGFSVITANLSFNNRGYVAYYTARTSRWGNSYLSSNLGFRMGVVHGYGKTIVDLSYMPILAPVIDITLLNTIKAEASICPSLKGLKNGNMDGMIYMLNFKYLIGE